MGKNPTDNDFNIVEMLKGSQEDRAYSESAAAAYCGMSDRYLRLLRSNGAGPAYIRFGKRVSYRLSDLKAFIEANRVVPSTEAAHV